MQILGLKTEKITEILESFLGKRLVLVIINPVFIKPQWHIEQFLLFIDTFNCDVTEWG